jgi:hypothetical protein
MVGNLLLRYLTARLIHRNLPHVQRYLRMGLGIEARSETLREYWAPHQERTKATQRRWDASGGLLTVLGAGRLLDFDAEAMLGRFDRFRLVDADPLCRAVWDSRMTKPFEAVFTDVSGCIDEWAARLPRQIERGTSLVETLDLIRGFCDPPPAYHSQSDAVLSLNLLSQLPVGWQDSVESFLLGRFKKTHVERHEEEWLDAVRCGNRALVEQHLAAFERTGAKSILLITDADYVQYSGRAYSRRHWSPEPVRWSEDEGWSADEGVQWEVTPALEGVDVEEALHRLAPSYRIDWQDQWMWHISPMAVECRDCGTVHRVKAYALKRPHGLN